MLRIPQFLPKVLRPKMEAQIDGERVCEVRKKGDAAESVSAPDLSSPTTL